MILKKEYYIYYNANKLKETISACGQRTESPSCSNVQSGDSSFLLY